MKSVIQAMRYLFFLCVLASFTIIFDGCNKEKSLPQVRTLPVTDITATTVFAGGEVMDQGTAKVNTRGVCWSYDHLPSVADAKTVDGKGKGTFSSSLTGLKPWTLYYVRAYATNMYGTSYGEVLSINTAYDAELVSDIDGNIYHTVTIGNQTWLVENLRVTRYRNGDSIIYAHDSAEYYTWDPVCCSYNDDPSIALTYGYIYKQLVAMDPRGLAPQGWHIPSVAEYGELITYLGGAAVAGGKMKETGTVHWAPPNLGAGNESGFNALPGGLHAFYTLFEGLNTKTNFVTSDSEFFLQVIYSGEHTVIYPISEHAGGYVRCIKNAK